MRRICFNCRETFRGFEGDPCEACGSYDTGADLGAEGCCDDEGVAFSAEDGFFEGDFDERDF